MAKNRTTKKSASTLRDITRKRRVSPVSPGIDADIPIISLDKSAIKSANAPAARLLGYAQKRLLGKDITEICAVKDTRKLKKFLSAGGKGFSGEFVCADSGTKLIKLSPLNRVGKIRLFLLEDITAEHLGQCLSDVAYRALELFGQTNTMKHSLIGIARAISKCPEIAAVFAYTFNSRSGRFDLSAVESSQIGKWQLKKSVFLSAKNIEKILRRESRLPLKPLFFNGTCALPGILEAMPIERPDKTVEVILCFISENDNGISGAAKTAIQKISAALENSLRAQKLQAVNENLKKSVEHTFENSISGMALSSVTTYRYTKVNRALCKMLGYSKKELEEIPASDITYPDDRDTAKPLIDALISGEKAFTLREKRYVHKNGKIIWTLTNATLTRDDDGKPQYFLTEMSDITGKKLAEKRLLESERLYRGVIENMTDIFFREDISGKLTMINPAALRLLGCRNDKEIIGKNFAAVFFEHPQENEKISSAMKYLGEINDYELRLKSKTGRIIDASLTAHPYYDENGNIAGIEGVLRDVSARKELMRSALKINRALEQSGEGLAIVNMDGTIDFANNAWANAHGFSKDEVKGMELSAFFKDSRIADKNWNDFLRQILADGSLSTESESRYSDGAFFPSWINASLVRDDYKRPLSLAVTMRDITQQKHTQEVIRKSQEKLAFHVYSTPLAYVEMDTDLVITDWNPSAERIFGFSREEVLGKTIFDINVPKDMHSDVEETKAKIIANAGGTKSIHRNLTKSGEIIICEWHNSRIMDKDGNVVGIVALANNITTAIKAQKAVADSERKFRAMFESANEAVMMHLLSPDDKLGGIIDANKYLCDILSYSKKELLSLNLSNVERDAVFSVPLPSIISDLKNKGAVRYEMRIRNKKGRFVDLEMQSQMMKTGEEPIIFTLGRDVTDKNRLNDILRKSKEAAERANKVKSMFLANMSHEIRTPLNAVIGFTELSLSTDLTPQQKGYLETIKKSGEHLLRIIDDVLDTSQIESGKIKLENADFDVRTILENVVGIFTPQLRDKKIDTELFIDDAIPRVLRADQHRLAQVLVNLMGNAVKFTSSGRIDVKAELIALGKEKISVRFSIKDTGIGIPADKKDRIFKPFVQADSSTTRKYGGTGLGLSISANLVRLMGGRLECETKENKGSEFFFTANFNHALSLEKPEIDQKQPYEIKTTRGLKALIAEDNPANLELLMYGLSEYGYELTPAENGKEVLETMEREKFDIILMDVDMPIINGITAAETIRKNETARADRRRIPIIAISAHVMSEDRQKYKNAGMDDYVSKPINRKELVMKIEKLAGKKPL